MAKVTVFEQSIDGDYDDDHPAVIRDGHLDLDEITKVANELGGVGNGGYVASSVVPTDDGCWEVSFAKYEDAEKHEDGHFEEAGSLRLHVSYD